MKFILMVSEVIPTKFSIDEFQLVKSLEFADIHLHESQQIIYLKYHKNAEVNLENGQLVIDAVYPLLRDGARLAITDATAQGIEFTKEARALFSDNKSMQLTKAHGVVVKELAMRILVNFYIKFNKPVSPVKMFNSYDKALEWVVNYED